jgi:trk system potassium uptake protein TrkA
MKIILVGGGKVLYFLARTFISKGYEVVIINRERCDCEDLTRRLETLVICGDGSDPKYLNEAQADEADVVVALTPHDPENLMICKLAEVRYKVPRTFALVNDPGLEEVFHKLGVTRAFSTTSIVSSLIEQKIDVDAITNLVPIESGKITVTKIQLEETSPAVNKIVADIKFPNDTILGFVIRNDEVIIPNGQTTLLSGDRIVAIALPRSQGKLYEALLGPE